MSFARAKRFIYKDPEITVSPADYDLPSSFAKACTACHVRTTKNGERYSLGDKPSCSKIHHTQQCEDPRSPSKRGCSCKRNLPTSSNTKYGSSYNERNFRRGLRTFSTPEKIKINITDSEKVERRSIFTRSDSKRISFREKNGSYIPNPKVNNKSSSQNALNNVQFCSIEEFFDDDYHSYTSSEEINNTETENVNINGYTALSKRNFKIEILRKVENISRDINALYSSFKELRDDILVLHLQHNPSKVESTDRHTNVPKRNVSDQLQTAISNTLENLKLEFSSKQSSIIRDAILKIGSIAGDMYSSRERCNIEIEDMCHNAASDLSKHILNLFDGDKTLECETSRESIANLKEIDAILNPDHQFFHYEDTCKTLTNGLQVSQKEINALKIDTANIMTKSGKACKEISNQTARLRKINEELNLLKNSIN